MTKETAEKIPEVPNAVSFFVVVESSSGTEATLDLGPRLGLFYAVSQKHSVANRFFLYELKARFSKKAEPRKCHNKSVDLLTEVNSREGCKTKVIGITYMIYMAPHPKAGERKGFHTQEVYPDHEPVGCLLSSPVGSPVRFLEPSISDCREWFTALEPEDIEKLAELFWFPYGPLND